MKELENLFATNKEDASVGTEGLMSKTARLRHGVATSLDGIVGWDYLTRHNETCYEFYAAQAPLIGMSRPVPVPCRLGIRAFNSYKIDAAKAIELLHTVNCGSGFVAMTLYWVLSPSSQEPEWHFRTDIGCNVVIGANSGNIGVDDPSGKCHVKPPIVMLYMAPGPEA